MQLAYWATLVILCGLSLFRGGAVIRRVIFAILGCGLASLLLVRLIVWPSDNYALAMMLVDAVAAYVVLRPPASAWQAVVGATYLTQILLHTGRVFSGDHSDMDSYYWGLSIMAWLQLAVAGGWWLNERRISGPFVRSHRAVPATSNRSGNVR